MAGLNQYLPFTCISCGNGTIIDQTKLTTTGVRRVRKCTTCEARFTTFQQRGWPEIHRVVLAAPMTKGKLKRMRRQLIREILWDVRNVGRVMDDTRAMARDYDEARRRIAESEG